MTHNATPTINSLLNLTLFSDKLTYTKPLHRERPELIWIIQFPEMRLQNSFGRFQDGIDDSEEVL